MEEAILLPSPNWFLVSGLAVSTNGWVFYGGPSKNLCVLEPLPPGFKGVIEEHNGYRAHVFAKPHGEKLTSVDVSPDWPVKQCIISGSVDGTVKHWTLEKVDDTLQLKSTFNHTIHSTANEEVAGVAYSTNNFAVTVGALGRIVRWDLKSNVIKTFNFILAKFKPSCLSCSHHKFLHVAVGTKQGVVFVLDLSDKGKILFKVRSHDEEILSVSWCPQYEVLMKKYLKECEKRVSANVRMERIRQEAEEVSTQVDKSGTDKTLPQDSFDESVVEEDDMFDIYKDHQEDEFGHKKYKPEVIKVSIKKEKDEELDYLAECQKLKKEILRIKEEPEPSINSLVDAFDKAHVNDDAEKCEDDQKQKQQDKSKECTGNSSEQKQTHLLSTIDKQGNFRIWSKAGKVLASGAVQVPNTSYNRNQNQKNKQVAWATLLWYKPDVLLITDGKGQLLECNPLNIDSKNKLTWKVVDKIHKRGTFCIVSNAPRVQNIPQDTNKSEDGQHSGDENLVVQNDDQIETKSTVVPQDQWRVWTAAQDRSFVCYSMEERRKISTHNTCGAIIYNMQACPYDPKLVAMCVGDGAVRVWEADTADDDDTKLTFGDVTTYWQNVQGKVLVAAWHPTRENVLAFGTAEARVGILDTSGSTEKPARVLNTGLSGGVYGLCWGAGGDLYACGGGELVVQCPFKKDSKAKTISVELEGERWSLCAVSWGARGLLCGAAHGGVAVLAPDTHAVRAVSFLFKKMIHSIEWHPQFTSESSEESSLKNIIAVSSKDRCSMIAILSYNEKEDGSAELETIKWLEGHTNCVLQLAWSPHKEGRLASTSMDSSVRVWDVSAGACVYVFVAHTHSSISLAWSVFPQLADVLFTGGSDHCVRAWRVDAHPPHLYKEVKPEPIVSKKDKKKKATADEQCAVIYDEVKPEVVYGEGRSAEKLETTVKPFKRFLMPFSAKKLSQCTVQVVKKFALMRINQNEGEKNGEGLKQTDSTTEIGKGDSLKETNGLVLMGEEKETAGAAEKESDEDQKEANGAADVEMYDTDFLKIFGTTNDLNELLDFEMDSHLKHGDSDAWVMLSIFRGRIDSMVQFASERDILCPFLVSIAPSVSFKYWKDVTQLYIAQIDRAIAQQQESQLNYSRSYGGSVFRKVALLLSVHDLRGAVDCLLQARLFREAYVLCRARHVDSIAQETLRQWATDAASNGNLKVAVICYIALGELSKASAVIASTTTDDEDWLSLAADLARHSGQHTFAGHLQNKKDTVKQACSAEVREELEKLPSRMELLLRGDTSDSGKIESDASTKDQE